MDNPYRLVQVTWQDSGNPHSGWKWVSSIENPPKHICQTVGWLVKDGKIVTIAQSIVLGDDGNHQVNGLMQIPRRFVNSIEDIETKKLVPKCTIIQKLNDDGKPVYDKPLEPHQEPQDKPADELPDLNPKENASDIFVVDNCKSINTKEEFSPRTYRKPYLIDYQYFQLTVYPEEDTDIGWDSKGREFRLFYNGMNELVDVQGTGRTAIYHEAHKRFHDGPYTDGKGRQWQMVWLKGDGIPKKMPYGWHPPEEEK